MVTTENCIFPTQVAASALWSDQKKGLDASQQGKCAGAEKSSGDLLFASTTGTGRRGFTALCILHPDGWVSEDSCKHNRFVY